MSTGKETPVPPFLPSSNVMTNGYFGGVSIDSANLNCVQVDHVEEVVSLRRSVDLGYITSTTIDNEDPRNKYKETEEVILHETKPKYRDMSAQMKEYNVNYNGLIIIPWEEFAENPRKLNDLFYLEKNGLITYDPDEVNVFFHATKMNKPTFGDISENGKAWVVNVEKIKDLEQVRVWLIERVSVFGVTLVRKTSRFGKPERAPCLVMLDPTMGHGDSIHASIMRCINVMQEGKKFCLEINLNGCVERWCRRITMTKCEAVGAKLVITNGEEQADLTDAENIICCIVCLPIWSIQAGIYKIHRRAQYKDLELKFDAEELFLHGTLGGVKNQRAKLFRDYQKEIFRTKPLEEAGEEFQVHTNVDRHGSNKYISVKKAVKSGNRDENHSYIEYETTDISDLLTKDNEQLKDKFKQTSHRYEGFQTTQEQNELGRNSLRTTDEDRNDIKVARPNIFVTNTESNNLELSRLNLRENTNSSDSSGFGGDSKGENKIKSIMEVESCTMRKELSPIPSARTVNSDIMIITQSNEEDNGEGSEIDLRTFLQTELAPPEKTKKKSKKHKRSSKPPKSPSKKPKNKSGVDNNAFDPESENKFRRVLPSKRRSLESIDTLESNDNIDKGSIMDSFPIGSLDSLPTGSHDSLDTILNDQGSVENPPSDNEVMSLKADFDEELFIPSGDEGNTSSGDRVFQFNDKLNKNDESTEEEEINGQSSGPRKNHLVFQDDISCDDLELSDFDADNEEKPDDHTDKNQNIPKSNNRLKQNNIRGSAPYRSNRQKYIGMNTSVKNERHQSIKSS